MSGDDTAESSSSKKSEWSSAWEAVSRLAATREPPAGMDELQHSRLIADVANGQWRGAKSAAGAAQHIMAIDHDELAGAVAEIERASAVLRRSEPALEVGLPSLPVRTERRNYWSVWILIGAIWISATLVVASATGAILYLLG
jgi:hypothetical protein